MDELDITAIPNVETVEMIWSALKLEPSSQAIITKELLQNKEVDDSYRDRQEYQATSEINIIYWWRILNLVFHRLLQSSTLQIIL